MTRVIVCDRGGNFTHCGKLESYFDDLWVCTRFGEETARG
jgi:hypothetical protein